MENHVADQLAQLGAAAALGAAGALVYDLLRAARLMDRRDRALTHLLDALFALALGGGLLWLALVVGGGELRLYMLTGMALGAAVWFCLPSRLLRPVWDFWAGALLAMCRQLWKPAAFLLAGIKKLAAAAKKGFSFLVKCAKMKVTSTSGRPEDAPQKRGGRSMRAKKPKRTKKCPSVVVMLVIVALVAVLGVQIVKVYGQLQAARQTETALDQQLTQQQQENEALRSDLARKSDESFIKALARDLLGLAEEGERIFYDVND